MSLKMTTAQVVEKLVTVNNGSIQDYVHWTTILNLLWNDSWVQNFHSNKDIANMVSNRIQFN